MLEKIDCICLEWPLRGSSNEYPQSMFEQKYENIRVFLSENFQFSEVKFSIYLNRHVFVMLGLSTRYFITNFESFAISHLFCTMLVFSLTVTVYSNMG